MLLVLKHQILDSVKATCAQNSSHHWLHLPEQFVHCRTHLKFGINEQAKSSEVMVLCMLMVDNSKFILASKATRFVLAQQ